MTLELHNILQIVYAIQTGFGALLLMHNRRYRGLVLLLFAITLLMVLNLAEEVGGLNQYFLITPIFTLSDGPLFFLFIQQLVFSNKTFSKKDCLHFIPALMCIPLTSWPQLVLFFGTISHIVYGVMGYKLIQRYHAGSRELHSNAEDLNLRWVSFSLFTFIGLGLLDYTRLNLQPYLPVALLMHWYAIMLSCYFIVVSVLIYMAVRQRTLFGGLDEYDNLMQLKAGGQDTAEARGQDNIKARGQDNIEARIIYKQIDAFLKAGALYKKPRLSLRDLSEAMGLQEKEVSWAINTGGNTSFCDYINQLRINEVKASITKNANAASLLELAFAAGFNSKSSFNAIFRKEVGMTPSQFLRTSHP